MSKINFIYMKINSGWLFQSLALLLLLGLIAGCGQDRGKLPPGAVYRKETVVLPTGAPTSNPTPPSTSVVPPTVFTPGPTPTITPIPDEVRALVVGVVDGDTIVVVLDGDPPTRTYQVRYLGVDVPPNAASAPWGVVAFEVNFKLVGGKVVRLERDQSDTDADARLLRYVYLGDQNLSITLAEQGLARANIAAPDTRFQAEITEAERRAMDNKLGLWGPPPTATPKISPIKTATITSTTKITITPRLQVTTPVEPEATKIETPINIPSVTTSTPLKTRTETPTVVETPSSSGASKPTVRSTPGGNSDDLQGPRN